MALLISCAWDPARIGALAMRFTDDGGARTPAQISTGRRSHPSAGTLAMVGSGGLTYTTGITSGTFASQLQTILNAATGAPTAITVSRSSTTGLYTIAATGTAVFSLDFTTDAAAGTRMRQILGMTGNRSGALSYTSQCTPKYLIIPRVAGRANYTGVLPRTGMVSRWMTDSGAPGSLGPTYLPRMARWDHQFESEGHVWHRMADADTVADGHQYSWEALTEDAFQQTELCMVEDSVTTTESVGFYLSAAPVEEGATRPVKPEMRKFTVSISADVMGVLP